MIDTLIDRIKLTNNPTVVGLDPSFELLPEGLSGCGECALEKAANAILAFNKTLIDALCDIVPAVKPQSAYYEMYGYYGVKALQDTIAYAKKMGMYVITDGKRGDIGTTSEAYAKAYLGQALVGGEAISAFDSDSLTVNPYLGSDGVMPFVEMCKLHNKSIFVLVKTSNKSSGELQDLLSEGIPIYEHVAKLVNTWGSIGKYGYSNVGAVVGATYPEQIIRLRELMPSVYFLVPGYGAQGGTAKDVARAFNKDGLGAVINASRSIIYAYKKDKVSFEVAARNEAIRMRDDLLMAHTP